MLVDVLIGLRALRHNPAFALAATVILALGIGASVSIFSILHAVLLQPFPYRGAERLTVLWTWNETQNEPDGSSYPNFRDWHERSHVFDGMTFYMRPEFTRANVGVTQPVERLEEGRVGPAFFDLLGVPAQIGRTISREEFSQGAPVVVLSDGLWKRRFGSSATVVGQLLAIDGVPHTIIGVMPFSFQLPTQTTQLWRPISVFPNWDRAGRSDDALVVLGRLKSGMSFDRATREMDALVAAIRAENPRFAAERLSVHLVPFANQMVRAETRAGIWYVAMAVALLLLTTCASVAGLTTARGLWRKQELTIRAALGATRAQLASQLASEYLVLGLVGGWFGLVVASLSISLVQTFGPAKIPRLADVQVSVPSLAFAVAVTLFCVVLVGILPAWRSSRIQPFAALRGRLSGGSGVTSSVFQNLLLTGQIALATVLILGATLLVRSFALATAEEPGFRASELVLLSLSVASSVNQLDDRGQQAYYLRVLDRVRQTAGVTAAGLVQNSLITRIPDVQIVTDSGSSGARSGEAPKLTRDVVLPGFFEAVGVRLLAGRTFDEGDLGQNRRVAVVNETMARTFWPDQGVIGRTFQFHSAPYDPNGRSMTVVGIVADMRRQGQDAAPISSLFTVGTSIEMDLAARVSGDYASAIGAIERNLREMDPSLAVFSGGNAGERLSGFLSERRFLAMMVSTFAIAALLVCTIGIHGLLFQYVATRRQDIAVRRALGASATRILLLLIGRSTVFLVGGLSAGLAIALATSRFAESLVYRVSVLSVESYAMTTILVLVAATIATIVPTLRAISIRPASVLRHS